MKTIEKACIIFQAFDGTEFTSEKECAEYEASKASEVRVNIRNFDIEFPMQDSFTSCRAYLIYSENEFEMLKAYILNEFRETYEDCLVYAGNGWYVVQESDDGFADLYKLSNIIHAWNETLDKITTKTIDLE